MLATRNRLRTSTDFSKTVRSGVRNGRRNVVLYTAAIAADEPSRIGFIVAKSVGNAVVRNLVKRRLREAGALSLQKYGSGYAIVVRALPASAGASWERLRTDYDTALETNVKRLGDRLPRPAFSVSDETTQEGTPRG